MRSYAKDNMRLRPYCDWPGPWNLHETLRIKRRRGLVFVSCSGGINSTNSETQRFWIALNIKMSGGKCPVVHADGLKWACERGQEVPSSWSSGRWSYQWATIEMLISEHSCRKDSQRDKGGQWKGMCFIRFYPCVMPTREGPRREAWRQPSFVRAQPQGAYLLGRV